VSHRSNSLRNSLATRRLATRSSLAITRLATLSPESTETVPKEVT